MIRAGFWPSAVMSTNCTSWAADSPRASCSQAVCCGVTATSTGSPASRPSSTNLASVSVKSSVVCQSKASWR